MRLSVTAAALLTALTLLNGPAPPAGPPAGATGAFFALSVRHLDSTAAWYQALLDLPAPSKLAIPDSLGTGAVLKGEGVVIELLSLTGARTPPRTRVDPARATGIFKVGLMVPDLDPVLLRLSALHVPIVAGPFDDDGGFRAVIVADNEGNLVHLLAPLKRDHR